MIGPLTVAPLSSRDVNGDRCEPPTTVGRAHMAKVKLPDPSGAWAPGFKASDHGTSMCPRPEKVAAVPVLTLAPGAPKTTEAPTTAPSWPLPVTSAASASSGQWPTKAAGDGPIKRAAIRGMSKRAVFIGNVRNESMETERADRPAGRPGPASTSEQSFCQIRDRMAIL